MVDIASEHDGSMAFDEQFCSLDIKMTMAGKR